MTPQQQLSICGLNGTLIIPSSQATYQPGPSLPSQGWLRGHLNTNLNTGTYRGGKSGGHDTTTGLIGNAILSLLRNPADMDALKENPAWIGTAVEEFLRFESPGPRNTRIALEDLQIGGQVIDKGQNVFLMVSGANRDPQKFPDPDRLDIHRVPNHHLAFGYGPHYFCLGAPLARLEGQIAVAALLGRLPNLRLANEDHRDNPPWRASMGIRALRSLPAVFS